MDIRRIQQSALVCQLLKRIDKVYVFSDWWESSAISLYFLFVCLFFSFNFMLLFKSLLKSTMFLSVSLFGTFLGWGSLMLISQSKGCFCSLVMRQPCISHFHFHIPWLFVFQSLPADSICLFPKYLLYISTC